MFPRNLKSDYMNFAKVAAPAPFNLATSGVADCTLADLDVRLEDLALHGPNAYGFRPLTMRVAERFGVEPAHVVMAGGGCSFSNHLAMAAVLAPGDEVLIEDPTYELLIATLRYLQADVRTFPRVPERRYALEVDAIVERLTPRTRLVVVTNLHNPSGALESEATIHAIADAAAKVGALVLVDEVYLELMFKDGAARTAFRPEGGVIVTSSLTKAYGLSGLRCGWILATAELAERMRRLNDLFGVLPPHVSERLSAAAFDRLAFLRARAEAMIKANRAAYEEILGGHPGLEQTLLDQGTTVFPRLKAGDGDQLLARLRGEFDTSIAPGRFFGRPEHIRVGLAGEPVMTRAALARLGQALRG